MLWKRPADYALSRDKVPAIARRMFCASYINHVSFAKCSSLWLALAEFGSSEVGHPPSLRLPRLEVLHVQHLWLDDLTLDSRKM
jgi:hypothetical protein